MKTIILFFVSSIMALAVMAQTSTVTINVKGERNKEILVDGQTYSVNTDFSSTTPVNAPITIYSLPVGQHTLEVRRANQYGTISSTGTTTTFHLRQGYNMNITVANNGSIRLAETVIRTNTGTPGAILMPMSDEDFSILLTNVRYQRTQNARNVAISNAFNNAAYHFSTQQARELIAQVNSQSRRLNLAKASYKRIVDPENFAQINSLLTSSASRRELAEYVSDLSTDDYANNTPMSSSTFNTLYQSARNQYSNYSKVNYIMNAFNNSNYYFTTTQVRQLIQLVTTESDRLALVKAAWNNTTDQGNYAQLYDLFNSTTYRNDFVAFASSNGLNTGQVIPGRTAMTDANFNSIYSTISNTWGLGAKMSSLTNTFNNSGYYFTTAQTRQLIQLVSSESNRLALGKLAFDNVVDPENYAQLYDVLASQSSRNELDAYVRSNGSSSGYTPVRTPMTGENFNTLYNRISNQWGLGVKYSSLTDAFANSSNLFTTAQTRQLIMLVSSESNRLQLAKSSYDNIVDPENFSQLYDIFSSQASRNELAAYISSYSYNR